MEGLNDLQQKMLLGVRNDPAEAGTIRVSRLGPDVIEVRAGNHRWYGKTAVNAVVGLMVRGLVTRAHRNNYELTEKGRQLASRIKGAIQPAEGSTETPAPPRDVRCPRCKQRLRPGAPRCHACGTRAPAHPLST